MTIRGGMNVTVSGWNGIAFHVIVKRKETAKVVMIGDDLGLDWSVPVSDCTPIQTKRFCSSCGQVGCGHSR